MALYCSTNLSQQRRKLTSARVRSNVRKLSYPFSRRKMALTVSGVGILPKRFKEVKSVKKFKKAKGVKSIRKMIRKVNVRVVDVSA